MSLIVLLVFFSTEVNEIAVAVEAQTGVVDVVAVAIAIAVKEIEDDGAAQEVVTGGVEGVVPVAVKVVQEALQTLEDVKAMTTDLNVRDKKVQVTVQVHQIVRRRKSLREVMAIEVHLNNVWKEGSLNQQRI